jgi:hypothetical protein
LAWRDTCKVRERWREPGGVPAHVAVIRIGIHGEAHEIHPRTPGTAASAGLGHRTSGRPKQHLVLVKGLSCRLGSRVTSTVRRLHSCRALES